MPYSSPGRSAARAAGRTSHGACLRGRHVGQDAARDGQRVQIVFGVVVGHARDAGVDVGAAQVLGADLFAGRGFDQRRAADEDRARAFDDDRLVAHRRHVGAAGGTRAHDHGHLGDAVRRQVGLVEEDPPEVLAVGKDVGLQRQEGAAGVDQVDARQAVLLGDFLQAQVFFDRHRVVRAAFDGGVVGDDGHLFAFDRADAR